MEVHVECEAKIKSFICWNQLILIIGLKLAEENSSEIGTSSYFFCCAPL